MSRRGPAPQRGYVLLAVSMALAVVAVIAWMLVREGGVQANVAGQARDGQAMAYLAEAGFAHARWRLAQTTSCSGYGAIGSTALGPGSYSVSLAATSGSPVDATASATLAGGAGGQFKQTIAVYGEWRSHQVRPLPSDALDVSLMSYDPETAGEDPDAARDDFSRLTVRSHSGLNRYANPLLQFDLATLRSQPLTVLDAQLELYRDTGYSTVPKPVALHRVTSPWVLDKANWTERDGGNLLWKTAGGDYAPTAVATVQLGSTAGPHRFDVTDLVRGWLAGTYPNYGLMLRPGEQTPSGLGFHSGDHADPTLRPRLLVTFACECGRECNLMPVCPAVPPDTRVGGFVTTAFGGSGYTGDHAWAPPGTTLRPGLVAPASGAWIGVDWSAKKFLMTDMAGNLLDNTLVADDKLSGVAMITTGNNAGRLAVVKDDKDSAFYLVDPTKNLVANLWVPITLSDSLLGVVHAKRPAGITYVQNSESHLHEGLLAILASEQRVVYLVQTDGKLQATLDVSRLAVNPQGIAHIPGTDAFLVVDAGRNRAGVITFGGQVLFTYELDVYGHHNSTAATINQQTCDHVVGNDGDGVLTGLDRVDHLNGLAPLPASLPRTLLLPMSADTYIQGDEARNNGDDNKLLVGYRDASQRTLLKPDLSDIPAGSSITSAWLVLNHTDATNNEALRLPPIDGGTDQTYVLFVATESSDDVTVSGGGLTWTERKRQCSAGPETGERVFTAQGSPPGSFGVTVTPATGQKWSAALVRYSGVAAFVGPAGRNTNGAEGTCGGSIKTSDAWLSLTSSQPGSVHVVGVAGNDKTVNTASAGYTALASLAEESKAYNFVYEKSFAAPATDAFHATLSGTAKWATAGVVLQPAAGGITREAVYVTGIYNEVLNVAAHRVDQAWTEDGAQWGLADAVTAWSAGPGGTYSSPAVATVAIQAGEFGAYDWDLTALVQEWVDGVSPDHGVELITDNALDTELEFASREEGDSFERPFLEVSFTPPAGAP